MLKVVITGAAGFLGSHLVERFIRAGYDVIGIDNLITGSSQNVAHIESSNFKFLEHNVIESIPVEEKVDGILHFASPASPIDFDKIPLEIMDVNSVGTRNCLEFARKRGIRFFMASTSEVYGDPLVHPQNEEYFGNVNPRGIRSVYDESKRFSEAMIYAYKRFYDVDVRVVRIFNTYGPRMRPDDGRVIPTFIRQAIQEKPITVFGDGKQTRSFCYVDDLIEGIFRLYHSDYSNPVNIGNPIEYTILELVQELEEVFGKSLQLDFKPLPQNDPLRRKPDITKAGDLLKWKPEIPLKEGLRKVVKWFKKTEVEY
ncbi:MAG: SDR family oxidoreductase [Candidatus Eremiobacteraeota bacterium]|nr:SDR family oxidoreductase [Candidatus Eremiobacteraeota bacterium]